MLSSAHTPNVSLEYYTLKRNGFDISLLEVEKMLNKLVEEGFIQREMPSVNKTYLKFKSAWY